MGENEVLAPSPGTDLSPVLEQLESIFSKQGEIIEQNKVIIENQNKIVENQSKLVDYFVPTDEEIEQQLKEQEEQEKVNLELQEEQEKKEIEKYENELSFQEEVTKLLTEINGNQSIGNEVSSISSSTNYTILLIIISVVFFGIMYKAIRAFI